MTRHSLHKFVVIAWLLAARTAAPAADQGPFTLKEPPADSRIESVDVHVKVSGTAQFAIEKGQFLSHPIAAEANLKFRERWLPGAGRDAEALRSLRHYDTLNTEIKVAEHATGSQLSADRRLVVAQGRTEGIFFYSPLGPLTSADLELLRAPSDTLCLVALLPPNPVSVGDKWSPPAWVGQMLTDTEAAAKSELTCTLESVTADKAKVTVTGTVTGATTGCSGKVDLHGFYVFDFKSKLISDAEIDQTEDRTVGPVSPGMKVTAKTVVVRAKATDSEGLTQEAASAVPLDPPAGLTRLQFRSPWNIELTHDRDWHVFQQNPQIAVLRLIEQGSLVAQCNLTSLRAAAPGEHVTVNQFQDDIRTSLGARFKSIEKAERVPTDDGRFLYRVAVAGEANKNPITWIYYLCAAPNGSQTSSVFAVDTSLLKRLGDRDLAMMKSLKFTEAPTPVQADKR
ncbi:MAG TPA: hypothetical protein VGP63_28675 [Planctomycetaceae bacterium]|jgi:hypothetical protein|nr:hypothetical protein [Planctomycetaceae bacterium]